MAGCPSAGEVVEVSERGGLLPGGTGVRTVAGLPNSKPKPQQAAWELNGVAGPSRGTTGGRSGAPGAAAPSLPGRCRGAASGRRRARGRGRPAAEGRRLGASRPARGGAPAPSTSPASASAPSLARSFPPSPPRRPSRLPLGLS